MNELMKFAITWIVLLVWVGVLLGLLVFADQLQERWQRSAMIGLVLLLTGSSTLGVGYFLSKPGKRKGKGDHS